MTYLGIVTWEHVPDPAQALAEMDRVLTPEGGTYLAPAWNCRSWTRGGVDDPTDWTNGKSRPRLLSRGMPPTSPFFLFSRVSAT